MANPVNSFASTHFEVGLSSSRQFHAPLYNRIGAVWYRSKIAEKVVVVAKDGLPLWKKFGRNVSKEGEYELTSIIASVKYYEWHLFRLIIILFRSCLVMHGCSITLGSVLWQSLLTLFRGTTLIRFDEVPIFDSS